MKHSTWSGTAVCLVMLASVASADLREFSISTLGPSDPVYSTTSPVLVSVSGVGAGDITHKGIAVGFLFDLPDNPASYVIGAEATSLVIPLFEDETHAYSDFLDARVYIVPDSNLTNGNTFDAPDLTPSAVVTTFAMPIPDWPANSAANGNAATLSTVLGMSTALVDDGNGTPYWLIMETSGTGGGFTAWIEEYWYRNNTGVTHTTNPFWYGTLEGGLETAGTGASPAYGLRFAEVPEPASAAILALGCVAVLLGRRRRAA